MIMNLYALQRKRFSSRALWYEMANKIIINSYLCIYTIHLMKIISRVYNNFNRYQSGMFILVKHGKSFLPAVVSKGSIHVLKVSCYKNF